jgi:hypothetical protein
MQFRADATQHVPLNTRFLVQCVTRQRQSDPRSAVDEDRFALPHQRSS